MAIRRATPVPIVAATALTALLAAGAIAVGERGNDSTDTTPTGAPVATADPVGAEEWMYLQRANPDGSIP
ncbi:MAG TPA: hypothetical protein VD814_03295, partial [Nocardioides sp.]|nr:hypothetical protein [Nocardioides sp.]